MAESKHIDIIHHHWPTLTPQKNGKDGQGQLDKTKELVKSVAKQNLKQFVVEEL